jgi:hypothetical protein
MNNLGLTTLLVLATSSIAVAEGAGKYQCTQGELVRRVEIYTEPGTTVPCEVHYFKDTEAPGEQQVLWSAQADAGYCQTKATEFVAKLEGWGWTCHSPEIQPPAPANEPPETEVEDDTDVLAPAESES